MMAAPGLGADEGVRAAAIVVVLDDGPRLEEGIDWRSPVLA